MDPETFKHGPSVISGLRGRVANGNEAQVIRTSLPHPNRLLYNSSVLNVELAC